jgi:hypothetical protein
MVAPARLVTSIERLKLLRLREKKATCVRESRSKDQFGSVMCRITTFTSSLRVSRRVT